ncbi:MAG: SpoIIE family protein phosphatase, partial [Aliifodinibius sp.]|nr:PP2C family protein-serine/threonine phosphatase [Fodinibius sp.]NIV16210.1 SpoIIE family protein phosphatase [Fodinibius sp.]NIY30180.1 SpoIIE family protein phosphatase [Fodinibius sp.]
LNLLPKSNPDIARFDIAGLSIPAENVGGDYYDFIQLDKQRLAIGLGDVSGKGMAAALVMSNLQATIRAQTLFNMDVNECLERANKLLFHSTDSKTFASLFYGILDTQENALTYANAGQNIPFIFSQNKNATLLKTHGLALGMQEDVNYRKDKIFLNPGEKLLIYSDGITEAMNEQMIEFGEKRLLKIVQQYEGNSASELVDKIIAAVNFHVGKASQNDDRTIIFLIRK